jgi:hypothetical protein
MRAVDPAPRHDPRHPPAFTVTGAERAANSLRLVGVWAVAILAADGRAWIALRDPRDRRLVVCRNYAAFETFVVRVLH